MPNPFNPTNKTFLTGHTSRETAYLIESYPYGRLRCKMLIWIETNNRGEQREVRQTENPKTMRWNNPKKSTYSDLMFLYKDHADNDHIKTYSVSYNYGSAEEIKENYQIIKDNNLPMSEIQQKNMKYALIQLTYSNLQWTYRKYEPATLLKAKKITFDNAIQYKKNSFENLFDSIQEMPERDVPKDQEGSYFKSTVYKGITNILNDNPEPSTEPEPSEREKLIIGIMNGTIKEMPTPEPEIKITGETEPQETPAPETEPVFLNTVITANGIKKGTLTDNEIRTEPEEIKDLTQLNLIN